MGVFFIEFQSDNDQKLLNKNGFNHVKNQLVTEMIIFSNWSIL